MRALALLGLARNELRLAFAGASKHPVFVRLSRTVIEKQLPIAPFEDLLGAFEQDQRVMRYETYERLLDYCTRSANPVGRIVLMLDGYSPELSPELFLLSDRICTALQLTKFWQDVRRDLLERDRIYLPRVDFGHGEEELRSWMNRGNDPEARVEYILSLRKLVERTDLLFAEGEELVRRLDRRLGPVVYLFHRGGRETLRLILRTGCTTLWQRPALSKFQKLDLIARAFVLRSIGRWRRERSEPR